MVSISLLTPIIFGIAIELWSKKAEMFNDFLQISSGLQGMFYGFSSLLAISMEKFSPTWKVKEISLDS